MRLVSSISLSLGVLVMSGTRNNPWHICGLEEHREVALEYGLYMADFSALESELYVLFSVMIGSRPATLAASQAILGHIQSLSLKITTMENFIPFAHLGETPAGDLRIALKIVRGCNNFRNSLAHGLFCTNNNGLHLSPYAFETRRKVRPIPISATVIARRRTLDLSRAYFMIKAAQRGQPLPHGMSQDITIA